MARIAASIDGETLEAIREVAGPRGVSAFLQTAARERLMRLRVLGFNRVVGVLGQFGNAFRAPDEATARLAGTLRFSSRSDDGIDALVAAEAAREARPSVVLTSDPKDLERLLANVPQVTVHRV